MWVIEEELSVSHRHPLAVSRAVQAVQRLEAIAPGLSAPMMRGTPGMSLSDSVSERLLRERIILLGSEVRDTNANEITSQLLLLAAEDPEKDITLYINSPGGSVTAGMAIYDTMMWIEPDVATTAMGLAASMGQFLLTAGAKGKRAALPHTRILMHQPSAGVGGTAADIAIQAEMLTKSKRELTELQSLAHRPADRADRDRPGPRPLVHRPGGPGVRVHRQGRRPGGGQHRGSSRAGDRRGSRQAVSEEVTG